MTSKRVSAPFDRMKDLESDDDEPKKQVVTTTQRPPPPKKTFTNGLFRPLSDNQVDMLDRNTTQTRTWSAETSCFSS